MNAGLEPPLPRAAGGLLAPREHVRFEPVNLLVARDETLEAVFVAHVERDQYCRGETGGESEDGDAGVKPVAREIAKGGSEVVAQQAHSPHLLQQVLRV